MRILLELLSEIPLAGLMAVVTAGYLLGRLQWREISLGPAGGTLAVALLFGWLGLSLELLYGEAVPPLTVGYFGFALFIYSVGFEAGPQFLMSLRNAHGWKCVALGSLVVVVALLLALLLGRAFGFDAATAAGVLAGGMTSAATYAAAAAEQGSSTHLSVAFALSYPVGLFGLVLLIQIVPRLLRTDLSQGSRSDHEDEVPGPSRVAPELTRAYLVAREQVAGKTLRELDLSNRTGCVVSQVRRGEALLDPHAALVVELGDHVLVVGRLHELQSFRELVGDEVYDAELRNRVPVPRRVIVHAAAAVGRTLRDLQLAPRFRVLVKAVERGPTRIDPTAATVLQRDDVVELLGPRDRVREACRFLGSFEPDSDVTDIALYAGGILVGLLLGSFHFRPLGVDLSLGPAGGLLLSGILLASLRRLKSIRAGVPRAARQLVRDLGVLLFVAETGVEAGHALQAGLELDVVQVMLASLIVTVVPVLLALAVGQWLFRMRPVDSWGSICGGMTSSAALAAVKRAADSNEPAVSYAAAFAVASVLVTVAGQVITRLLG